MIIPVNLGAESYDIVLEQGALEKCGRLLNLNRKVLIVTDTNVPEAYANTVASASKDPLTVKIKAGEESKNFRTYEMLLTNMLENDFSRKDCVVAVGGGVVGDLAGFVAATYMRGVDFYNIPTTVLSQVDSSIGGKTAIDLAGIKNIVGAFYQPKKVIIDMDVLKTLPSRQISNGLAEALKMSMTSDPELFEIFENEDIASNMDTIIERSLKIKRGVVEQDEKEKGLRKILNFGHTIGHAVESESTHIIDNQEENLHITEPSQTDENKATCADVENAFYHGECVALGMIPMCSPKVRERLIPILKKLSLPTCCELDPDKIYEAMIHDKKAAGGTVSIVRVNEIGSFEIEDVKLEVMKPLINMIVNQDS